MEPTQADLRAELEALERREEHLSIERRRLHDQLDKGFANEVAIERERKISEERLAIHHRIDELRALLRQYG